MAIRKKFPNMAALVACAGSGQAAGCAYGCTGCGACVSACKFSAIVLRAGSAAAVDEAKCTGCGACVRVCPQRLIHIHACANYIVVKCANRDKGAAARRQCAVSCIGCGVCERICTASAIHVRDNCAVIDEDDCLSCGMCATKCPRGVLHDLRGICAPK